MTYTFWILSAMTLLSALAVVFTRNPIYSVLSLILCFFSISGHYLILGAPFLAVVNIIVYAGAIMVLFLFVIMLMNLHKAEESRPSIAFVVGSLASLVGLLAVLSWYLWRAVLGFEKAIVSRVMDVKALGQVLFRNYWLPFELSSLLFLAAVVGVVLLAAPHQEEKNS